MPRIDQNLKDSDPDDAGGSWHALPDGEYVAKVTDSEYKITRAGDGKVLKLTFVSIQPGTEGRKWFENLTLEHPNPDTVRIAKAKLKALAIACNHPNPDQVEYSEELHDLPVLVKLKRVKDPQFGDEDGWKNEIMAFKRTGSSVQRSTEQQSRTRDDIPF